MWQLLLASFLWAFSYSINKQTLTGTNPFVVSLIFCTISSIIFAPCLKIKNLSIKSIAQILYLGAIEFGLMYVFFQSSFFFLDAYEIAILLITTPIYVVLLDGILNKQSLALPCFLASICILLSFSLLNGCDYSFNGYGLILTQGSNISFALGQVLLKRFFEKHAEIDLRSIMSLLYLGGGCTCLIFILVINHTYLPLTFSSSLYACLLGIICCGVCHYLWDAGVLAVKTPVLAVMNNVQIPLSILISTFFFGEKFDFYKMFTAILMIAFILLIFLFFKYKKL